jgi:ankyrin repeat protein
LRNTPPLIRALTSPYPKQAGHLITLANINELLRTHDINSYIGDPAEKTTLLMLVAERGTSPETAAIIAELVRRGAKINAQDRYGRTALHRVFTVSNQQYKFVDITDASGEIVERQTVACGLNRSTEVTAQVVKQLLDSGIDVFIKDKGLEEDWNPAQEPGFERSAFYYAGIIPSEITKLLTSAGAHYDSKTEWERANPKSAKAQMIAKLAELPAWTDDNDDKDNADTVADTVSASAERDQLQAKLNQKLFAAIIMRVPAYVTKALQAGADVNAIMTDSDGCTALIYAIIKGNDKIVKLLIEAGADVNIATMNGWTALRWATDKAHVEIIELLLQAGTAIPDDLADNEFVQAALTKLCRV